MVQVVNFPTRKSTLDLYLLRTDYFLSKNVSLYLVLVTMTIQPIRSNLPPLGYKIDQEKDSQLEKC